MSVGVPKPSINGSLTDLPAYDLKCFLKRAEFPGAAILRDKQKIASCGRGCVYAVIIFRNPVSITEGKDVSKIMHKDLQNRSIVSTQLQTLQRGYGGCHTENTS